MDILTRVQGEWVPIEGQWPVGPQEDVAVEDKRIWIDGCFDFSHHGTFASLCFTFSACLSVSL